VTIITAPAGSGKTSLLRSWAGRPGQPRRLAVMQRREMRTLAASPDYVVGSVHALTEGGSLLIASASGS